MTKQQEVISKFLSKVKVYSNHINTDRGLAALKLEELEILSQELSSNHKCLDDLAKESASIFIEQMKQDTQYALKQAKKDQVWKLRIAKHEQEEKKKKKIISKVKRNALAKLTVAELQALGLLK